MANVDKLIIDQYIKGFIQHKKLPPIDKYLGTVDPALHIDKLKELTPLVTTKEPVMVKTPLNILVVGQGADQIMKSKYVQELIAEGDIVSVMETPTDMVIGTTAVRTYYNTTHFLKGIVKKIRQEKETGSAVPVPKKKKAVSKKKVAAIPTPMPATLDNLDYDEDIDLSAPMLLSKSYISSIVKGSNDET